jgi:FKBP-type peptidyl-prolyl cis-trans isomerase FklB
MTIFLLRHLLVLVSVILIGGVAVVATDEAGTAYLEEKSKLPDVVTLPSGLRYKVLEKGQGGFHPKVGTPCLCHYAGTLIDGTEFDSSYSRGEPTTFAPNQVIKGWTEAMQLMVEGDKWELYIPSDLAYGDRGSPPKIPGDSALVFTIEMIEIQGEKVIALTCDPKTLDGCDEKMKEYIKKAKTKYGGDRDELEEEVKRLMKVSKGAGMKDDLKGWFETRVFILQQMILSGSTEEEL